MTVEGMLVYSVSQALGPPLQLRALLHLEGPAPVAPPPYWLGKPYT